MERLLDSLLNMHGLICLRNYWSSDTEKGLSPQFFCFFFSFSETHQSHPLDRCQAMVRALLFFFSLFEPSVFYIHVPFNEPIVIAMIIVTTPCSYLLFCHIPVGNTLQWPWTSLKGPGTHFLCYTLIGNTFQLPWVAIHQLITYFLSYVLIRNILQHACYSSTTLSYISCVFK